MDALASNDLSALCPMLDAAAAELKTLQNRMGELTEYVARVSQEIAERLRAGDSTGDPIRDYVMANALPEADYGSLTESFRALEARLTDKSGQFILLHTKTSDTGTMKLGVLTGERLVFDLKNGNWHFPTDRHITDSVPPRSYQIVSESLGPWPTKSGEYSYNVVGKIDILSFTVEALGQDKTVLHVGDEEALAWFESQRKLLSQEAAVIYQRYMLKVFQALGREVASIPGFEEHRRLVEERILKELDRLLADRKKLIRKLELMDTTAESATLAIRDLHDTRVAIVKQLDTAIAVGLEEHERIQLLLTEFDRPVA